MLQACHLRRTENLMKLVDERLGSEVNPNEAELLLKVALLCTNASPSVRPTMSEVVNMLEGRMSMPEVIPEPTVFSEDSRFQAIRDIHQQRRNQSLNTSHIVNATDALTISSSSVFDNELHEISTE